MLVVFILYIFIGIITGAGLHFGLGLAAEWSAVLSILVALVLGQMHLFMSRQPQELEDLETLIYDTRKNFKNLEQKVDVVEARAQVVEDTLKTELDAKLDQLVHERKSLDAAMSQQLPTGYRPAPIEQDVWQTTPQTADTPKPNQPLRPRFIETVLDAAEEAPAPQNQRPPNNETVPTANGQNATMNNGTWQEGTQPIVQPSNDNPLNAAVRDAILEGQINLQLQKIVSLPQRQVKLYECFGWPQDHGETIILPKAFDEAVRNGGMGPALDAQTLYRTLAIQRKLTSSDRRIGLLCNMNAASFLDTQARLGVLAQIEQAADIARTLIISLDYVEFLQHADYLLSHMKHLTGKGVRFALRNTPTLAVNCDDLLEFGVRFLSYDLEVLQRKAPNLGSRPTCFGEVINCTEDQLSDAFARQGVSLIVRNVETETDVSGLLDWGISLAQGDVFAPPKALKPEVLKETQPDPDFMQRLAQL